MPKEFDAIVIGTGQAGPYLASRLAGAGKRVAIIERKFFGGTCVNTGCIPTKTMVASAYAAQMARRAAEFGVNTSGVSVDMTRVKQRKDAISGKSRTGVEGWMRGLANAAVYQGHARFESPHQVSVGEERLAAAQIFINVGGRATVPPIPGVEQIEYLTNSSMMDLDTLPRHLIVIGGSYIGLEFGQMFRRFGSEVTIIETSARVIPHEDEDISTAIREILEREGVKILLGTHCIGLAKRDADIVASVEGATGKSEVSGSHLLFAVGRRKLA
jgi:pyruvate/2-oxoglutarate dehydrogenase complex dihydrolipoamide dehydrogenase (E3) component